MSRFTSFRLFFCVAVVLATPLESMAVEVGPAISRLWIVSSDGAGKGLGTIDYVDTISGLETLSVSHRLSTTPPDAFGKIKSVSEVKVAIREANGSLVANLQTMYISSRLFPDPCDPDNQLGGITETWYRVVGDSEPAFASPSCAEDIADMYDENGVLNAAIGNSAGERTLVFGLSVVGSYRNPVEEANISVYKIFSYDADSQARLCAVSFDHEAEWGWELFPEFSGVGPYLGGSDDVLRVAYEKDTATDGISKSKYDYYDIRSCQWIQTRKATSPAF